MARRTSWRTGDGDRRDGFSVHLTALACSKVADGLIDPKLVLSWLMNALGAPGYLIGALVPVREAGALLPQIGLAQMIQARAIRKVFWSVGAMIQGLMALGIAFAALALEGAVAGWAILGMLAVFSVGRAACSASHKDVLSRTVEKGRRGTLSGVAGSIASVLVFLYAAALSAGVIAPEPTNVALGVALAGALWVIASLVFATLDEPEADPSSGSSTPLADALRPVIEDEHLRTYIAVRGLLIVTALAPPFIVMSSGRDGASGLGDLGLFLIASSAAAILSSYLWGRLSDWSSRKTLVLSGALAALTLGAAAALGWLADGSHAGWLAALFIFAAQVAYEGVRAGRKTHLTDMDAGGEKARYTALSNTIIGVMLLCGGAFGALADIASPSAALAVFAVLSLVAALSAFRLEEVQSDA